MDSPCILSLNYHERSLPMKVAIYARVSTTNKGQDVDLQLRDLRAYIETRKLTVFAEYIDKGVSGTKDTRPALDQLMNDARKRRFNMVLVWRFDRFARSTRHLVTALDEFRTLGIDFVSFQENIDTTTPMGRAMFSIVAAMAQFEAEIIRERVMAGIANARAKGKRLGRPAARIDTDKLVSLRKEGRSYRQIASETGIPKSVVHKALNRVGYV